MLSAATHGAFGQAQVRDPDLLVGADYQRGIEMEKTIETAAQLVELTEEEVHAVAGGGPETEASTGVKGYN
jgi:hypothetical protein